MTDLAMRAGASPDQVEAYVAALEELVGARDPLEILQEQVEEVRREVAACPPALRRAPEGPGKWSVAQIVRHLADMEGIFWYRMRLVVSQPGDPIQPIDQDAWATAQDYAGADIDRSLDELDRLRAMNLAWLAARTDDDWEAAGLHEERGRESLRTMVRLLAGHDLAHRAQLRRVRETVLRREGASRA